MRSSRLGRVAHVLLAVALAACTGRSSVSTDSGTTRFIAGDGIAYYVAPGHRELGPRLVGTTLDDTSLDVDSLRADGPVVVNIWASWCAPCKKEQPGLERAAKALYPRGVRFVGIDFKDSRVPAKQHVAKFGVSYPSLFDPSGRLLTRFETAPKATPSTYVIDTGGRIAAYVYGPVEEAPLTDLVERVLAEPA